MLRTFDELRGSKDTSCTSLAYWIGIYRGAATADEALSIAGIMDLQYDSEEQGRVIPEDNDWTRVFRPIAPVQLTRSWSPVPRAVDMLGPPVVEGVEERLGTRTVAAVWSVPEDVKALARRLRGARASDSVEKRFLELLAAAAFRSVEKHARVLLAARPGWSFEHVHPVSGGTAAIMKKAGFVVTTRRPADAA